MKVWGWSTEPLLKENVVGWMVTPIFRPRICERQNETGILRGRRLSWTIWSCLKGDHICLHQRKKFWDRENQCVCAVLLMVANDRKNIDEWKSEIMWIPSEVTWLQRKVTNLFHFPLAHCSLNRNKNRPYFSRTHKLVKGTDTFVWSHCTSYTGKATGKTNFFPF